MNSKELIKKLKIFNGFKRVYSPREIPSNENITYCVVQGTNILTIGSGAAKRLKTLMGNKGTHNKAPIIGLCNRLFSEPIEFYICSYTKGRGSFSIEERDLQKEFGEIDIEGNKSYKDAMKFLRNKLNIHESSIESILLDLMETHGDVLQHALSTESTAETVEQLFDRYWRKSKNIK